MSESSITTENSLSDIDRTVHEPARLMILSQLYVVESADFLFVMHQTGLTQGNLSSHMSKLEAVGYIEVTKEFEGKRPRTLLQLTSEGRGAFEDYVSSMKRLLDHIPARTPSRKSARVRRVSLPATTACLLLLLFGHAHTVASVEPRSQTIEIPFLSHDGYEMFGKLTLPNSEGPHPVVIYAQTAEGMTVDVRRPNPRGGTFNYFDLYREKLPEMNVAFFSYEGRGIRMGDAPPRYEQIDWDVYNTSTLENKIRDILTAVELIRNQKGVDPERVFVIGTSEGTFLAAGAATRAPEQIKGLILYAVMSGTLKDALAFQAADGAFLALNLLFDTDKDGKTSRAEFDADVRKYRERALKNVAFEQLDPDGDGFLTVEDMRSLRKPLVQAIETEDFDGIESWLKVAATVTIPKAWLRDHFAQPDMWSLLSRLEIPVGLFHGSADNLTSMKGTMKLESQAKQLGKSNLKFHYFEGLDHSLGITAWFARGSLPEGHKAIFEFIRRLVGGQA